MGHLREMVQSRSASEHTVTVSSHTLFDVLIMLPNLISELPSLRKGILPFNNVYDSRIHYAQTKAEYCC